MREKSPSSADRRSRIHLRQDVVATYVAIRSYDCTHAVEQDLTVFQRIFNAHTCLGELCFVLSVFSKLASLTYSQAQRRGFRSTQLELHIVSCQHRLSKLHSFHVSAMCYMLSDFKWRSKRPRRLSNDPYERFSSTSSLLRLLVGDFEIFIQKNCTQIYSEAQKKPSQKSRQCSTPGRHLIKATSSYMCRIPI